ncbi:hypothetical protein CIW83_05550 [Tissierella sp. P1]|uniref:SDR family NAD(P)-dependent oxidoreductase n=1 Tax=Tissierella sp. P1 TaxID=1280483 RepID=UPI000BA0825F|nr:SDR family oxidoreductase [Tissierella sp. P1]OZV13011.1 hypothetical protein CIW83_05550 [Tissierella sp. P1]
MLNLNNQIALITGSSGYLGRDISMLLARHGATVILHYNESLKEIEKLEEEIKRITSNYYIVKANLTQDSEIVDMFKGISNKFKKIDILINNAGIAHNNYLVYMQEEQWDEVLDVNLKAAFLCSKYSAKMMIQSNKGCIINVISGAICTPSIMQVNYIASKGGLAAVTKALAKELGPFGIRVNAVSPGPLSNKINKEQEKYILKTAALNKICTTQHVANTVLFLCSSMAEIITGQIINVDGGITV